MRILQGGRGVRRNRKTLTRSFIFFFVIPSFTLYTLILILYTFMSLSQNIIPFLNVIELHLQQIHKGEFQFVLRGFYS